jgi:hypothetical protein
MSYNYGSVPTQAAFFLRLKIDHRLAAISLAAL